MCDFEVGQLVVCIRDVVSPCSSDIVPVRGVVYRIRDLVNCPVCGSCGHVYLWLDEIRNSLWPAAFCAFCQRPNDQEPAFRSDHFRPLRDEAIERFREIARGAPPDVWFVDPAEGDREKIHG